MHNFNDEQIEKLKSYDDKLSLVAWIAYKADYLSYARLRSFIGQTEKSASHDNIKQTHNKIEEHIYE